jgi:hypothetical protein
MSGTIDKYKGVHELYDEANSTEERFVTIQRSSYWSASNLMHQNCHLILGMGGRCECRSLCYGKYLTGRRIYWGKGW